MQNSNNNAMKIARKFLAAWKRQDYDKMYEACTPTWRARHSVDILKEAYPFALPAYEVKLGQKVTEVVYDIKVKLKVHDGERNTLLRVICEKEAYRPSIKGEFYVNPVSFRDVDKIAKQPV